jgi:hypothetical protein
MHIFSRWGPVDGFGRVLHRRGVGSRLRGHRGRHKSFHEGRVREQHRLRIGCELNRGFGRHHR